MMNDTILLFLSNAITAVAAWLVGRKKQAAETDNQVLKNLELSISLYKDIIDSLKSEIESLNIKIQHLETKMDDVMKENRKLKSKNSL
jgi:predicted  nucleic acid-binding Zn-ribbon protein